MVSDHIPARPLALPARPLLVCAALAGAAGCNWTVFDDLADETWVDRVTKPDETDSRQYGEVVLATPTRREGTNIVVVGRAEASISQLPYDADGKRQNIASIDPTQPLSFANFAENPAFAVDSGTNRIAFTVVQGNNTDPTRVAVYDGSALSATGPLKSIVLPQAAGTPPRANILAEGITFTNLPTHPTGGNQDEELVIARGPTLVLIRDFAVLEGAGSTFAILGCTHDDEWSFEVAVGDVDAANPGPEIMLATGAERRDGPSRLQIIAPDRVSTPYDAPGGCNALSQIDSAEAPMDLGSQLAIGRFPDDPATDALDDLVYSAPSLNKVFVRFGSGQTAEINAGDQGSDFGDAVAVADLTGPGNVPDGIPEIIVGAPKADVGATNGGAVYVFSYDPDAANRFTQIAALGPAAPEVEERFGKSVTVAPFGPADDHVLVVGAEGEVFTFFRTSFYPDVRTGR
jgi:hypothetical protein